MSSGYYLLLYYIVKITKIYGIPGVIVVHKTNFYGNIHGITFHLPFIDSLECYNSTRQQLILHPFRRCAVYHIFLIPQCLMLCSCSYITSMSFSSISHSSFSVRGPLLCARCSLLICVLLPGVVQIKPGPDRPSAGAALQRR